MSKVIPKLRFKGFDTNWLKRKLGEVATITTGSTPSTNISEYYSGDYLFVSPSDISETRFVRETKTTLTKSGFDKGRLVPKGSILFVCIGSTIGKVGQAAVDCITNQQINSLQASDHNSNDFIYSVLEKNGKEIKLLAGTQAVPLINKSTFSSISFYFPSLPEQQKIASFLSALDEKIHKLTQKKELLEQYKKGVRQQLFSGKLRFKDESGKAYPKWERQNGNLIFESISDKKHNSDLPILAITQEHGAVPRELIDYNVSVTDKSIESYKVVQVGDFIISLRSFQGGIEYSSYKGICSPAYIILRPIKAVNNLFYRYYFKTENYISELNKNLEGIRDGKMISFKYFSEILLPLPSLEEQNCIVSFLSSIDSKIESINNQITQTQTFKKGLLQQMFV